MAGVGEQDVFSRLSRILETSDYQNKDDKELEDIIMKVASPMLGAGDERHHHRPQHHQQQHQKHQQQKPTTPNKVAKVTLPDRPTSFEVWQARQELSKPITKAATVKLSTSKIDQLISKMHRKNRSKQDEVVRVQNEGLREELGGYKFKPEINDLSKKIAKDNQLQNLHSRLNVTVSYSGPSIRRADKTSITIPEMVARKLLDREKKVEEQQRKIDEQCSFKPERQGAKVSDKYLQRMGRSAKARPEDFFNYQREKERRNEQRKQIIDEIESKHLVFTPTLPQSTYKMHESLSLNKSLEYDPVTRTSKVLRKTPGDADVDNLTTGPTLLLESEHPYRNNLDEYTVISVPGAVSYCISFKEPTSTEPVHDYVRFLKYDNYEIVHGCGKYSGGLTKEEQIFDPATGETKTVRKATSSNWCGIGGRPQLVINSSKFVVHFKTNREVVDWGFAIEIVPTVDASSSAGGRGGGGDLSLSSSSFQPEISRVAASSSRMSQPVHERLYNEATEQQAARQNLLAELVKNKLNVTLAPWEQERKPGKGPAPWAAKKTHVSKSHFAPIFDNLLVPEGQSCPVAVAEYSDSTATVWKALRAAHSGAVIVGLDEQ